MAQSGRREVWRCLDSLSEPCYRLPEGLSRMKKDSMTRIRLTTALGMLLLLRLAGAGEAVDTVEAGKRLISRGQYEEAITKLQPVIRENTSARLLLAEAFRRTGAYEKALELLAERPGEAALRHAAILCEVGRLTEAEARLESLEPSPQVLLLLGDLKARRGDIAKAREAWNATIPLYEQMTFEEAEKAPPELFVVFGRSLVGLNRFQEANEVMLEQALEKDPENLEVLLFAGELFAAKYDFGEGRMYFGKARKTSKRHPDVLARCARATLDDPMVGATRLQTARDLAEEALAVNPHHELALLVLGDTHFFDGCIEQAAKQYRQALETNPSSQDALGAIYACAHLNFHDDEKARAEAKARSISSKPAAFYHAASKRCDIQNQYPVALQLVEKGHAIDPSYWPLYTSLALGQLRTGRYKAARQSVAEGFKRDSYNIWLENTRKLFVYLDANYTTEPWKNLVFHVPRKTAPFYVNYLGPLLMRAAELFTDRYGVKPPEKIHVEVYPRQEYFAARTIGLPDFPAQGVCFGRVIAVSVHPLLGGNHAISTWHEFAHVFTVTGSDYRIPRWLTEGISVREEGLCPMGGTRSYLGALGRAIAKNDLPTFSDFDQRFRRPRNPTEILTAYALSPLAVEFLIERFGHGVLPKLIRALKRLKFPAAFTAVTGARLQEFDAAFQAKLRKLGARVADEFVGEGLPIEPLERKVKAGTATPREMLDLAWAYAMQDKDIDAETLALKLRDQGSVPAEVSAILGLLAYRDGAFTKATKLLQAGVEGNTRNRYRTLLTLAKIAQRRKDTDGQVRALVAAWQSYPELAAEAGDHGPLGQLCRIWSKSGDKRLPKALADLVAYNRETRWARTKLAETLERAGDRKGQFQVLRQLLYLAALTGEDEINTQLLEKVAECADSLDFPVEAARARRVLEACR